MVCWGGEVLGVGLGAGFLGLGVREVRSLCSSGGSDMLTALFRVSDTTYKYLEMWSAWCYRFV